MARAVPLSPQVPRAPLIEGRDLRFSYAPQATTGTAAPAGLTSAAEQLSIHGSSAYLHGTKRLIDCIVDPKTHLRTGRWLLLGEPAQAALRSGVAAICPSVLPWPSHARLDEALITSAGLLGKAASEVQRVLSVTGLSHVKRTRLVELSPEEHRRTGLAHGLLSDPRLMILVQPFRALSDTARADLSRLIEQITADRSWVMGGEAGCEVSQAWSARADVQVRAVDGKLALHAERHALPDSYFVRLAQPPLDLVSALRERGARVTRTENPRVLLVEGVDPTQIEAACASVAQTGLLGLEMADERCFRSSHARSEL